MQPYKWRIKREIKEGKGIEYKSKNVRQREPAEKIDTNTKSG
jgi:hypothetical protein